MELFKMDIIEHSDIPAGEAWIILSKEAPQVPQDLKNNLPIPCIITGNLILTKNTLSLLRSISAGMQHTESASPRQCASRGRAPGQTPLKK